MNWRVYVLVIVFGLGWWAGSSLMASTARGHIDALFTEAERVQQIVVQAQQGCEAIRQMAEAYWLSGCHGIVSQPRKLLIELKGN